MAADRILALRAQGEIEQAYEAARQFYATNKGTPAALAMFWTAVDMLKKRKEEGGIEEAERILLALERLYAQISNKNESMASALQRCQRILGKDEQGQIIPKDNEKSLHTQMGRWGEEVAEHYLYSKGYDIIEQDWHSGHRDIDIIAQRGNLFVFVEVKTRCNREFGDPIDAIDYRKRYNLRRAITHYVRYHHIDRFRFDIITVVGPLHSPDPDICHYEDINIQELEYGLPRKHKRY